MKSPFPICLLVSVLLHACLFWVVRTAGTSIVPDRPAYLPLELADFSMVSVASAPSSPRPDIKGIEKPEAIPVPPVETIEKPAEKPEPTEPQPTQSLPPPERVGLKPEPPPVEVLQQMPSSEKATDTPEPLKVRPAIVQKDAPKVPDKPKPKEAPATSTSSPASLPQQGVKTDARMVGSQKPIYPREAQLRGMEGTVVVLLRLSAEGRVLSAKLQQSSGHKILDDHTLRFGEGLRFVPAYRGNTPVESEYELAVRYRLIDAQ